MKKILFILVALLGITFTTNAQSCKISGASDGSTVMVANDYLDGNKIVINLENDSEKTCANVTVEVEVTYTYSHIKETYTGRGKSCPGSTCKIEIPVSPTKGNNKLTDYKVKGVSGTKCENF